MPKDRHTLETLFTDPPGDEDYLDVWAICRCGWIGTAFSGSYEALEEHQLHRKQMLAYKSRRI